MLRIKRGFKYYHHLTQKGFVSKDVTFFEFVMFLSSQKTPIQESTLVKRGLLFLCLFPLYCFDGGSKSGEGDGEGEVTQDSPIIEG